MGGLIASCKIEREVIRYYPPGDVPVSTGQTWYRTQSGGRVKDQQTISGNRNSLSYAAC